MTTVHFPKSLTEEEEILMKKYAKLRKKKKALQATKVAKSEPQVSKEPNPVSRSATDSAEIKEDIKKLVKAGAIKLDSDREKRAFKRKVKDFDRPPEKAQTSGFHPIEGDAPDSFVCSAKRIKSLSESFVSGSDSTSGTDGPDDPGSSQEKPYGERRFVHSGSNRRGNTVCINGHGINEKLVRDSFSKFGEIVNIKIEPEMKRSFLSFATNDSADKAIESMDKTLVNGVYMKVMLARRQPNFNVEIPQDTGSSQTLWGSMAANRSQKGDSGDQRDSREMVRYDAEDLF